MKLVRAAALTLSAVLFAGSSQAAPAPVQTPDQLQSMFDQGQYAQLLPPLNQALADKALTSKADTHYALLMLKGETMLRMKASDSAADSFRAAGLVGADDKSTAIAKATAMLVKKSSSEKYQPKAKGDDGKTTAAPIDIVAADNRKQAFTALFSDLYEPQKPLVAAAAKSSSLSTITDAATPLADVRNVEIAATGSDAQTKELLTQLATRATELMNAALKPMTDDISKIQKDAEKQYRGVRQTNARGQQIANMPSATVGLSPQNTSKLDSIISQAREISTAAEKMQPIFGDAGDFKTIKTDADKIVKDGDALLSKYKKPTE